jgi:hypothetical protein
MQRLVQPVVLLQFLDHLFVLTAAGLGDLGLQRGEEITLWQLDDDKGDDRHQEKDGDHGEQASQSISQHCAHSSTFNQAIISTRIVLTYVEVKKTVK